LLETVVTRGFRNMMRILPSIAIAAAMLWPGAARAGLLFEVDAAASSVSITETVSGPRCTFTSCGIDVALAPGLDDVTFELETGESFAFSFLIFIGSGRGASLFDITATLAFSQPTGANTTGSGHGGGILVLSGYILAGALTWIDLPREIILANGSTIIVNFQGGKDILLGHAVTTTASVSGTNIVPEPAMQALLGTGLLVLGLVVRRQATG
jgi:hypothetical protein